MQLVALRLVSVSDGANTTTYAYNGDGDRVSQAVDGVTTTYLLDIATPLTMVLAEQTGSETIAYLHGLDLVAQSDGVTTEYFAYDGLGSVRQVADATGSPLLAQTFDPYGSVFASVGSGTSSFGFTGEQTDPNGLVCLRARYYQPGTGQFFQPDPSRKQTNLYQYALANPISYTDPSGEIPPEVLIACLTALALPVNGPILDIPACLTAAIWLGIDTVIIYATVGALDTAGDGVLDGQFCLPEIDAPAVPQTSDRRVYEDVWNLEPIYRATPAPTPAPEPAPTPGRAPLPLPTQTPRPRIILYHYTFARNIPSILLKGLRPSLEEYGDAMQGDGQYFTDLTPQESEAVTRQQHSAALFVSQWRWGGGEHAGQVGYIAVEVQSNQVIKAAPLYGRRFPHRSIYVYPNRDNLPLADILVDQGTITLRPGPAGYR